MLTRVLCVLALSIVATLAGFAQAAQAEETKLVALGVTDRAVTEAELAEGSALAVPRFNTPGVAHVLLAGVKKGDVVEVTLNNKDKILMRNTETIAENKPTFLLQVGKQGVPAGGWPDGSYYAAVKLMRDGKPLLEKQSEPVLFE
jgi:hypothetical protein